MGRSSRGASFATADLLHMTYKANVNATKKIPYSLSLLASLYFGGKYSLKEFLYMSLSTKY